MTSQKYENRVLLLHAALDGELDAAGALDMERMLAVDQELAAEYARTHAGDDRGGRSVATRDPDA
jgi:anti-sigma factor RsiW